MLLFFLNRVFSNSASAENSWLKALDICYHTADMKLTKDVAQPLVYKPVCHVSSSLLPMKCHFKLDVLVSPPNVADSNLEFIHVGSAQDGSARRDDRAAAHH